MDDKYNGLEQLIKEIEMDTEDLEKIADPSKAVPKGLYYQGKVRGVIYTLRALDRSNELTRLKELKHRITKHMDKSLALMSESNQSHKLKRGAS